MSAQAAAPASLDGRAMARVLLLALLLGVVAAVGASVFLALIDKGQELMFVTLPESFGWETTPWWWAAIMLLMGAVVVALARLLPGHTGQGPLTGFHFDDPLSMVPSVLVAAFGTLVFGLVLGPEAPLIVLGTAIGAIITRRADEQTRRAAMMLGGVAAIGAIFGNPFVTAFMILEFMAMGMVPVILLVPTMVALASGYLVQIGILGLPGLGLHSLSVPGLPPYDSIEPGDIVVGLVVALVAGIVAVLAREGGVSIDRITQRRPVPMLFVGAVVTALVLLVAQVGFGVAQDQILFSGNSGMGDLVQETSITAVIVILVGKAIAYAFALGSGFRGGPIFPATFLGVSVGVLASLVIPGVSVSALAAAGIAAAAAGMLRLPATSALLGTLLIAGGGADIAPFAILRAVVGLLIRLGADARLHVANGSPASTPSHH